VKPGVAWFADGRRRVEVGEVPTTEKAELMRSVNDVIALFAADSGPSVGDRWSFMCECGALDCREWVERDLADYEEIRAAPDREVLAAGHVASSQHARREAQEAREGARALRAQAELQRSRAQRLVGEARNVVPLFRKPDVEATARLTRVLGVLEDERDALALMADDRLLEVLVELDELELVLVRALASFESQPSSA